MAVFFKKKPSARAIRPRFEKHTLQIRPQMQKRKRRKGAKKLASISSQLVQPSATLRRCGRTAYDQRSTNILDQEGTKNEQFLGRVIFFHSPKRRQAEAENVAIDRSPPPPFEVPLVSHSLFGSYTVCTSCAFLHLRTYQPECLP